MGVDCADAAVAEQVVAGKQQVAEAERKLPVRVAGRVPDLQFQPADANSVAVLNAVLHLHHGHVEMDILSRDLGVRDQLVARFQRLGGQRMACDCRLENLLGLGEALNMVDVGVRSD